MTKFILRYFTFRQNINLKIMKITINLNRNFKAAFIALLVLYQPAISQKLKDATPAVTGANYQYNYPAERYVEYLSTGKVIQLLNIEGQEMVTNVKSMVGCSVKSSGNTEKNIKLEIKIDSMSQKVESMTGNFGGPITEPAGKVFRIEITPTGKEVDLSEAKTITFSEPSGGTSDLSSSFSDFFPDLPAGSVNTGDTWISNDSINIVTASSTINTKTKFENKFEGTEKINGYDCIKITSNLSGTLIVLTQSEGTDVKVTGPFTGTAVLYFSPSEGYFIRYSSTIKMKGNVEVLSMSMTIPIEMEMTSETNVTN